MHDVADAEVREEIEIDVLDGRRRENRRRGAWYALGSTGGSRVRTSRPGYLELGEIIENIAYKACAR